jgi:hypothetical protein
MGDEGGRMVYGSNRSEGAVKAKDIRDQREVWAQRLERVRRSQARTDVSGMRRPPRDPDERAFLAERDLLGPFPEDPGLPEPMVVRRRRPA